MTQHAPTQRLDVSVSDLIIDEEDNKRLSYKDLDSLASSIRTEGLICPITVVRDSSNPTKYRVVAGFRRAKASVMAKMERVAVVVREEPQKDTMMFVQLAENLHRDNLSAYETAWSLKAIQEELKLTREALARRLNKSLSWLSNYLGLFDLPGEVQEMAKEERLGVAHIRFLHAQMKYLPDGTAVVSLAARVEGMSQAQMELVRGELEGLRKPKVEVQAPAANPEPDDEYSLSYELESVVPQAPQKKTQVPAEKRLRMRPVEDIRNAIHRLNEQSDFARTDAARAKLVGQVEALEWALGSELVDI